MNKRPTKAETREELESKVQEYLEKGGSIHEVQQGASALHDAKYQAGSFVFGFPKQERTPIPEVMAAIDSRRHSKTEKTTYSFSKKPRKKIIYDDFGEPVREVWVNE